MEEIGVHCDLSYYFYELLALVGWYYLKSGHKVAIGVFDVTGREEFTHFRSGYGLTRVGWQNAIKLLMDKRLPPTIHFLLSRLPPYCKGDNPPTGIIYPKILS